MWCVLVCQAMCVVCGVCVGGGWHVYVVVADRVVGGGLCGGCWVCVAEWWTVWCVWHVCVW